METKAAKQGKQIEEDRIALIPCKSRECSVQCCASSTDGKSKNIYSLQEDSKIIISHNKGEEVAYSYNSREKEGMERVKPRRTA
ncbi:hypothetical protein AMTR_s00055p00162340 [Amborella trichopoda]|uniref:Uncharacterized protein n=1 Tax=Amborella trichopoda TaxID=13333 RepID=U5D7S1_AMBTC|nr:hypothetical protein AMTR_s00055p00162340 [Amborella trichopoda]